MLPPIDLPDNVSFEVPRDYAAWCKGTIVQVSKGSEPHGSLKISWDDQFLTLEGRDYLVRYKRDRIAGLLVDPSERVMGHTLCTLRVLLLGYDGGKSSLLVLSTRANPEWMKALAGQLTASDLPITAQVLGEDSSDSEISSAWQLAFSQVDHPDRL